MFFAQFGRACIEVKEGQGTRDNIAHDSFSSLIDHHLFRFPVQHEISGTAHAGIHPTQWGQVCVRFALMQKGGLVDREFLGPKRAVA